MLRKMMYPFLALMLLVFTAPPSAPAMDMGVQSAIRVSPLNIEQSLIGARINQAPWVITPKAGFGISDQKNEDTLKVFTFGCGLDYYLSEQNALKPYVGADFLFDYVDVDDSDTALSILPHIGAEYFLNKNFSLGADVGLYMGFGDYYDSEFRFGTATTIFGTYYFGRTQ